MATLHCEFSIPALRSPYGSSIHGKCVFYEGLTVGSATSGTAATAIQRGNSDLVVRLTTDTACFIAIGTTPNTAASEATAASSAKRFLAAGATITQPLMAGEKVGVVAA